MRSWLMLGIIHARLASYRNAQECLRMAIGVNARNFDAHVNPGLVY